MSSRKKHKALFIVCSILVVLVVTLSIIMGVAVAKSKADQTVASGTLSMLGNLLRSKNDIEYETFGNEALYPVENFRVSMSAMNHWENGTDYAKYDYTYTDGNGHTATDLKSLQQMFNAYGATEMYVRINTTRHYPSSDVKDYYHAKMHCLDESLKACEVANELGMPINVEVGCFAAYSDAFESQYPDFSEYTDSELGITYPTDDNGKRKEWKDMSLEEICLVLKGYGKFLATQIKDRGTVVEYWDLGNETNYGFGGIMMPLQSSVSRATSKQFWVTYLKKNFGANWLAKNIWGYNGKMFASLKEGIKEVYPEAKFSSHISTVTWGADYTVKYFKTLEENGYKVDQAGISFYPNATGVILDKIAQIKQIVLACNEELGVNVMLAEYGYANETGLASGTFASWNNEVHGYKLTDEDGAKFLKELIVWGKNNGMAGIRPWAPELDWANPWFDFNKETKTATAKQALFNALSEAMTTDSLPDDSLTKITKGNHGFCIGYVVLILDIISLVFLAVMFIVNSENTSLTEKLKLTALKSKKSLFNNIWVAISGVIFLFALMALCLHICAVSIFSFVLSALTESAFITIAMLSYKRNKPSSDAQDSAQG